MSRILVVDDKPNFLALFRRIIGNGIELVTAADAAEALSVLARQEFDVVVSDVKMPGADGIELLRRVKLLYPEIEVILMTAFGAVPDAVSAMKAGAFHYLTKPFDPDDALALVQQALARRTQSKRTTLAALPRLVAASLAMQDVLGLVACASTSDGSVIVSGENGTGKEVVARELHSRSGRNQGPFVAVDGRELSDAVIEHGGLFKEVEHGTLFIDHFTELPIDAQSKLLQALEHRAPRTARSGGTELIDVRIVVATAANLAEAVSAGSVREDLFYHLNVFAIHVPPLRERREDVEPLVVEFLERSQRDRVSSEALAALVAYDWPGNVRQLESVIAHASAVATDGEIGVTALPKEVQGPRTSELTPANLVQLPYREVIAHSRDRSSKEYLVALLRDVRGNVTLAAERAGLERESLHRLLNKYGLRAQDFRAR